MPDDEQMVFVIIRIPFYTYAFEYVPNKKIFLSKPSISKGNITFFDGVKKVDVVYTDEKALYPKDKIRN
jgi:hypothetical protein